MKEEEMFKIATLIDQAIKFSNEPAKLKEIRAQVLKLTAGFPLYSELKGNIS